MSSQALAKQPEADIVAKPAKSPRIPKRIVQLVDLITSGKVRSRQAACEKLNLDPSYVSRELRKVHVATYLEQQTRVTLAQLQVPAVGTLARLMAEGASEHVQNDVAKHVLAIAGHKPRADAQVSVNIDIKAGYVIDLTDEPKLVESSAQRIAGQMAKTQVIDNAE
jgi:hypothetical protein